MSSLKNVGYRRFDNRRLSSTIVETSIILLALWSVTVDLPVLVWYTIIFDDKLLSPFDRQLNTGNPTLAHDWPTITSDRVAISDQNTARYKI